MSVLVDTSVWVAHFRQRHEHLVQLLVADQAMVHPLVLGELACGTPPEPRQRTLRDIGLLRTVQQATLPEVMGFIEQEQLHGLGCGIVDVMLLASTRLTPGATLWTLDQRLDKLCQRFQVSHAAKLQ
ncbi:MAG: type II toxin-antitoxin system VapC family toxin [Curvibacter sp.]|nr:MAG: type II toxin-antitoxin system VapC family toxin [Curvibacter sp.]